MSSAAWITGMRGASVLDVAVALGMPTRRARNSSGGEIFRCPSCGAERRHSKSHDRRGAVGIRPDCKGWRCWQCDVSGDAVDLISRELCGSRLADLDRDDKTEVRSWCCTWLGIADDAPAYSRSSGASSRANRKPMLRRAEMPEPAPVPEPTYMPAGEIAEFWARGTMPLDHPAAGAAQTYCDSRRIDYGMAAALDMARSISGLRISGGYEMPPWAHYGSTSWRRDGYHLIVPLYDVAGAVRSVVARNVLGDARRHAYGQPIPKSLPPRNFARRGLTMMCPLAREVFRTGARPAWWPVDRRLRLEICEGEIKFLMRALLRDADYAAPGVIGIESGAWTDDVAARIPDGTEIVVMTDIDGQGPVYASRIVQSLAPRILAGTISLELRDEFELQIDRRGELSVRLKELAA